MNSKNEVFIIHIKPAGQKDTVNVYNLRRTENVELTGSGNEEPHLKYEMEGNKMTETALRQQLDLDDSEVIPSSIKFINDSVPAEMFDAEGKLLYCKDLTLKQINELLKRRQ